MKLYKKQFTVYVIFIVVLVLSGCSNPDSRREALKLIEKQAKVLDDENNAEKTVRKIQKSTDSLEEKSFELIEKEEVNPDLKGMDTASESLKNKLENKQPNQIKKEHKKSEKNAKSNKDNNFGIDNTDSTVSQKRDTIYVQGKQDLAEIEHNKKADTTSNRLKQSNKIDQKSFSKNQKDELKNLDNEIAFKKAQIDSLKEQVEKEAEKIIQKQAKVKDSKTAGVSKLTKIITVLIVIALVMFIILYIVGKQGLDKKK